jgi:hypothetical protein
MVSSFSFVNGVMNPPIRAILWSPLRFLLDGSLIRITYIGRKSGRRYSLVTMYARFGNELIVVVAQPKKKRWWRNFHESTPADVRLKGKRYTCVAQLLGKDVERITPRLEAYWTKHPSAARLYGYRRGEDGKFSSEDLARAAKDAVMVAFELPPGQERDARGRAAFRTEDVKAVEKGGAT